MEEKFGKPHPELENYKEPAKELGWIVESFFRLHRRRGISEFGMQPLTMVDIATFGSDILCLDKSLIKVFFRYMEEIDNAVLSDYYTTKG